MLAFEGDDKTTGQMQSLRLDGVMILRFDNARLACRIAITARGRPRSPRFPHGR
jgi:hypothetical protein